MRENKYLLKKRIKISKLKTHEKHGPVPQKNAVAGKKNVITSFSQIHLLLSAEKHNK